jgi:hypothetical protein
VNAALWQDRADADWAAAVVGVAAAAPEKPSAQTSAVDRQEEHRPVDSEKSGFLKKIINWNFDRWRSTHERWRYR